MIDSLYIASRYLRYHRLKTAVLLASITLIIFVPSGVYVLVGESAEQLRNRARSTPLIVGAKGSPIDLVLNSLYFESATPHPMNLSEFDRIQQTGKADVIPLYVKYKAKERPIVGTTLDYFEFRELSMSAGRNFAMLGECVLGANVAQSEGLQVGGSLLSTPENMFDLAGEYPLKMHVVGVLDRRGTPDDGAVFVDVKTTWIIAGLGHGHQDLKPDAAELLLEKEENRLTANAAVKTFTEITPENVSSFHFHGDMSTFPLTAVIAKPRDEKSTALLMGHYLSPDDPSQIVETDKVMDSLLATILTIRSLMIAGAVLLGVATFLTVLLVFALAIQLRQRELSTMAKLGCSRFRIISIVSCEIILVIGLSAGLAAGLTLTTRQFGELAIRWFLL